MFELTEEINKERLKYCIDRYDSIVDYLGKNGHKQSSVLPKLTQLYNRPSNQIKYRLKTYCLIAQGDSIQNLLKCFRTFITNDLYTDIDMKSSHPTIYRYLCKHYNLDTQLFDTHTLMKKDTLTLLNGGDNYGYVDLQDEVFKNRDIIITHHPNLYYDDINEPVGSVIYKRKQLSRIFLYYQNEILNHTIQFLQKHNKTIGCLFYDGLFVKSNGIHNDIELLIPELEMYIENTVGIPMLFKIKIHDNIIPSDGRFKKRVNRVITQRDDRYVRWQDIAYNTKYVLIHAFLGTGKTHASIEYLNQNPNKYERVIIITPRISYATSVYTKFNESKYGPFTLYTKTTSRNIKSNCIIQFESLHRLNLENTDNLLIIADECEGLFIQATSTETNKHNHTQNIQVFETLIENGSKVVFMDAFLCKTKKAITFCNAYKLDYKLFEYTMKPQQRYYTLNRNKDDWINLLVNRLKLGKKIFIFSSSKYAVINSILPSIERFNPLVYTADHKSSSLADVNKEWKNTQVVVCTSSITIGISYDNLDFDEAFIYVSQKSQNLPRDIFQALYRVRTYTQSMCYAYVDMNDRSKRTSNELYIINDKFIRAREGKFQDDFLKTYYETTGTRWTRKREWLIEMFIANETERAISTYKLDTEMTDYFEYCKYEKKSLTIR